MVHHNPGEARYQSRYNDPAELAKMGYGGKVYSLFESPELAVDWNAVEPGLFEPDSAEETWRLELFSRLKREFARCRENGLKVYAMSDLVLLPRKLIGRYPEVADFGNVNDPMVVRWLQTLVALIFDQFPEMDGLVVRIGETYLEDAPYHVGKITDKKNPDRTIIPLMTLLREEVCVKHGRELFFRTWGSFDEDVDAYQRVSDAVEPHEKLVLCVKHCEGDFHRGNFFNPFSRVIGMGRHRQVIEVQCAREYEGKGAFPNYIARGVIEGFPEHAGLRETGAIASIGDFARFRPELFAGLWTWTRGGGWEGPYIKNELWCDLNASVLARWAADPAQSEESVFSKIARERVGLSSDSLAEFRELSLLSADAVLLGRTSLAVPINPWWLRDEYIGVPELPPLADNTLLAEKAESIAHWKKIVELARRITWPDLETREFAITSAEYGLRLFRMLEAIFHLAVAEQRDDLGQARVWLQHYGDAWQDYLKLAGVDACPTLYQREIIRRCPCTGSSAELAARLKNLCGRTAQQTFRNSIL
jgi:hypothetical protein